MNLLQKAIVSVSELFEIQQIQYPETLTSTTITIPAGGAVTRSQTIISRIGDFMLTGIRGSFSTLSGGGTIVDDGVCYISAKMADGGNQRQLFSDYVPLELFLSPGRTRSSSATNNLTTAAPSNQLFYPFNFPYTFAMDGMIQFDFINSSTTNDQTVTLLYDGYRLRNRTTKINDSLLKKNKR